MYIPKAPDERAAISSYWTSPMRRAAGKEALVTTRVNLPFEEGEAYVVNPRLVDYINLLYVGQDTDSFSGADYETHGSEEFKRVLAEAGEGTEIELEGALKCEALGYSLRHGTLTPVSDVVFNRFNPMEGSVTFRIGAATEKPETVAAEDAEPETVAA